MEIRDLSGVARNVFIFQVTYAYEKTHRIAQSEKSRLLFIDQFLFVKQLTSSDV